jgi:hypothetical protein
MEQFDSHLEYWLSCKNISVVFLRFSMIDNNQAVL